MSRLTLADIGSRTVAKKWTPKAKAKAKEETKAEDDGADKRPPIYKKK